MNIQEITQKHGPGYYWVKYENKYSNVFGWDFHLKKYDENVEIVYNPKGYNTAIFEFNNKPGFFTKDQPRKYTIQTIGESALYTQDTFLANFAILDYKFLDCELYSDYDDGKVKVPFKNVKEEYEKLKKEFPLPPDLFFRNELKMNMPAPEEVKSTQPKRGRKKKSEDKSVTDILKEVGLE